MPHTYLLFALCLLAICTPAKAQDIDSLLKKLDSKAPDIRIEALMRLADLGPKGAPATNRLAGFLTRFDDKERELAVIALGKIGKPAVAALEKLLTHEDEMTRRDAVWALGLVGKPAKNSAPALGNLLAKDPDAEVRAKAAFALTQIMPGDPDTLKLLAKVLDDTEDCFGGIGSDIAQQLAHWGEPAIPILAKALRMPNSQSGIQPSLVRLLEKHQTNAAVEAMRPHILAVFANAWEAPSSASTPFDHSGPWQQKGMSSVLAMLGYDTVQPLEAPLQGKDAKERKHAIMTLARMAHTLVKNGDAPDLADKIVKQLVPFCQHADLELRTLVLSNIPHTRASDAALRAALTDEENAVRRAAYRTLSLFRRDERIALFQPLAAPKGLEELQIATLHATLHHVQAAQRILRDYLTHPDAALRHRAAYIIGSNLPMLGIHDDDIKKLVVPILADSLKSNDPVKRRQAAEAIRCGPDVAHVPLLLGLLRDKDALTRQHAIYALAAHASDERQDIVTAVKPFLQDPNWRTRSVAVNCLIRSPKSALPALVHAYTVEKEISIIPDQVMRFLLERDDPSCEEAILQIAARKEGVWPRFGLIRKNAEKYFPKVLAMDRKHDAILDKTIGELPKLPATIDEAMTELSVLLKAKDKRVQRRAAYSIRRIANYFQNDPSPAFVPVINATDHALERLKLALQDKDPEVRRDAVVMLWQLAELQNNLWNMFRGRYYVVAITKQIETTGEVVQQLLRTARGDSDLAIRRLARDKSRSEPWPDDFK